MRRRFCIALAAIGIAAPTARAQHGYEFEVYSTHIEAPRATAIELHTNYVHSGSREIEEGVFPTHRDLRSSFEISRGINKWLEASVYFVGAVTREDGARYVGNRLRVTTVAPASWRLPFAFGLSQEVGFVQPGFAENRWQYELSPIMGKSFGPLEFVLNPSLEKGLAGSEDEIEVEPKGRITYSFGDEAALSLEYYGGLGGVDEINSRNEQRHQLFLTAQTEVAHKWELGVGVGRGLTPASDKTVLTTKIEYSFGH